MSILDQSVAKLLTAILEYMFETRWRGGLELRHCSYRDPGAYMNDLDRVFRIIDGKDHQPHALQNAINTAMADGNIYEDGYFHVKGFRNGNMHLKFKRTDLLDKANRMIGDYYNGNALAADRQRAA